MVELVVAELVVVLVVVGLVDVVELLVGDRVVEVDVAPSATLAAASPSLSSIDEVPQEAANSVENRAIAPQRGT